MTFEKLYKISTTVLSIIIFLGFCSVAGGCARQNLKKQEPLKIDTNYHSITQYAELSK